MKKVLIIILLLIICSITVKETFSSMGPCIINGKWGEQNYLKYKTYDCVDGVAWDKKQKELARQAKEAAERERQKKLKERKKGTPAEDTWSLEEELKKLNRVTLGEKEIMTSCQRVGTDFDSLCYQVGGEGYGYKKLVDCKESNRFKKAVCSNFYRSGMNIFGVYDKITGCMPQNTNFEKVCQKISGGKLHADRVQGFNCAPMRKRATCNKIVSKPVFGDTRERANLYNCQGKC